MSIEQIQLEIRNQILFSEATPDVGATVLSVLLRAGFDPRHTPSLEVVKHLLVDAYQAADTAQSVCC